MSNSTTRWLLDTNVVSGLRVRQRIAPAVAAWFGSVSPDSCFLSRVTIAEILNGIAGTSAPKRSEWRHGSGWAFRRGSPVGCSTQTMMSCLHGSP